MALSLLPIFSENPIKRKLTARMRLPKVLRDFVNRAGVPAYVIQGSAVARISTAMALASSASARE